MSIFPLLVKVEEVAVGRVLRILHATEGVADIQPIWDDIAAPRGRIKGNKAANGHAKPIDGGPPNEHHGKRTGAEIIMAALIKGPQKSGVLKHLLIQYGYSETGLGGMIAPLLEKGFVERPEPRLYQLTAKARAQLQQHQQEAPPQLPAPKPAKEAKPAKKPKAAKAKSPKKKTKKAAPEYGTPSRHLRRYEGLGMVATLAEKHGGIATREQIKEHFLADGLTEKTVMNLINNMRGQKLITEQPKGTFRVNAKGQKKLAEQAEHQAQTESQPQAQEG